MGGSVALVFDTDHAGFVGQLDGEDEEFGGFLSLVGELQVDDGKIYIHGDHTEHYLLADIENVGAVDAGVGSGPVFGGGGDELGQSVAEFGAGGEDDAVVV